MIELTKQDKDVLVESLLYLGKISREELTRHAATFAANKELLLMNYEWIYSKLASRDKVIRSLLKEIAPQRRVLIQNLEDSEILEEDNTEDNTNNTDKNNNTEDTDKSWSVQALANK